jgi:hypothetical protein
VQPHRHRPHWIAPLHLALLLVLVAAALAPLAAPAAAQPPAGEPLPRLSGRGLGRPGGYLSGPAAGDPEDIARAFIQRERRQLGLRADDIADLALTDRYTSAHNGLTHLYFRQRLDGISLFSADLNINVARDGRILNLGNGLLPRLRESAGAAPPASLRAVDAVGAAARQLGLRLSAPVMALTAATGADGALQLSDGGISYDPIPARLVYMPLAPGDLRLSWELTLRLKNDEDWLNLRLDAASGKILSSINYFAHADEHIAAGGHVEAQRSAPPAAPDLQAAPAGVSDGSSYRVYAFPKENPYDGERTLLSNPADPTASPFGWHDTDGQPGAEFTITRGNNVHAYQDLDQNNLSAGDEPDGGAGLDFDQPLDLTEPPVPFVAAATTNLFYASNYLHDVLFRLGFDEAAGNFQQTNYGGAGAGGDPVAAESQAGTNTPNANFGTPPDGEQPRMQMYVGLTPQPTFTISAPAAISGDYFSIAAPFGPQNFSLSGEVVLVNDGAGSPSDGCEPGFNAVAGKIALVELGLGGCEPIVTASNALAAGAIGLLVANTSGGSMVRELPGSGAAPPTLSISQNSGTKIKDALAGATVSATIGRSGVASDGSFDNGVIAHEYGHGLSNRLTGGPSSSGCLTEPEQAGEGWSDFLGLVLTAQPADTAAQPIAIGNWLMNQPASADGLRLKRYSTDMTLNGYTYGALKAVKMDGDSPRPHDVGEIWATMLWDMYWRLVERYGFDADLLGGAGGNRLALQLVIDGLKLQPCNPTFSEARDAILAADVANNAGANQCLIWDTFARRGLGYSADAGSSNSHTDGSEAFDLPSLCTLSTQPEVLDVCIPASASLAVNVGELFAGPVTLSASGLPPSATASFSANPVNSKAASTLTIGTAGAAPVGADVTITGAGPSQTFTYDLRLNLASVAPATPALSGPAGGAGGQPDTPTLSWAAPSQAASYRLQIDSEPTFTDPLYDLTLRATSFTPGEPLSAGTTYFWRVSAANGCGRSTSSAAASFTVRDVARILLVNDGGGGAAGAAAYAAALNALGRTYDIWAGASADDEPSQAKLRNYRTVIWFGRYGLNDVPSPSSEVRLASWLPSGRCLLLSAQELFIRRNSQVTPFMRDYLGVASMADDSQHTRVSGVAGTLFAGLGPLVMTYASDNYSDHIEPNAGAALVLTGNGWGGGGAAIARDGGSYRSLYMGFPAEVLAPADLRSVLGRALAWCDEVRASDLGLSQTLAPAGAGLLPGQPIVYTLSFRNDGTGTASGVRLALTVPGQLAEVTTASTGPALTPVAGQPYSWDVASMAPGASGTLTLRARVRPTLAAPASFRLSAAISGAGAEIDAADQTMAAALTARVPGLAFAGPALRVAEDAGSQALVVRLSEPNPHAATRVNYAVSGGTATSGADFTLAAGTLTIPAGASQATISFAPRADALAEGDETVLIGLTSPQGAALGAPAALTITIGNVECFALYLPLLRR